MPSATTSARPGSASQAWQFNDLVRTKLYIPQVRAKLVARPALIARLNEGLARRLTVISAPAGFGKTTLLSAWIAGGRVPAAWVSLDERDNDPLRFATYLVAALETLELGLGRGLLTVPRGERPSAGAGLTVEAVLTRLINEITEITEDFVLVLDDYHAITAQPVHAAVTFLLEHLPPPAHLVVTLPLGEPPPSEEAWHATPQRLEVQVALIRAFAARFRGDLDATIAYSDQALRLAPAICGRARAVALIMRGHARLLQGDAPAGDSDLAEACALSHAAGHMAAYVSATNYLATLRIVQGKLRQAAALYRDAGQVTAEIGAGSLSGIERIGLGTLLREQHDLAAAEALIDSGVHMAEAGGDFTFIRDGYVARARLEQARGHWEAALEAMFGAEQVARRSRHNLDIRLISAWRARLCLARGDRAAAVEWAQASGLRHDDPAEFLREYEHLTLARVLLAEGRLPQAAGLLARLVAAAEASGRFGRVIEALVVLALVEQAQGEAAQATLRRALRLAEPEGYVRVFLDEGEPMLALLAQARGHPEQRAYVDRLLALAAGEPAAPTAPQPNRAGLTEPLSEREQVVLRLLAAGLSKHDIAQELVVAQSAVHWHVKNIYSKLNVHSWTQAANAARDLGLVA